MDPLCYLRSLHEISPGGPKFATESWGLKPKPTGLPLVCDRGDSIPRMLAQTASWA